MPTSLLAVPTSGGVMDLSDNDMVALRRLAGEGSIASDRERLARRDALGSQRV